MGPSKRIANAVFMVGVAALTSAATPALAANKSEAVGDSLPADMMCGDRQAVRRAT